MKHTLAYHDAAGEFGAAELLHDYWHPTYTGAETEPNTPAAESGELARSGSGASPQLVRDPYSVGFAYALTVAIIVTVGLMLALAGVYLTKVLIFLLGDFITLVGALLYGRSLREV